MDALLYVEIDFDRLRANFSAENGEAMSEIEVRRWLREAGFSPAGEGWVVRERDLGQLHPDEYPVLDDWPLQPTNAAALAG